MFSAASHINVDEYSGRFSRRNNCANPVQVCIGGLLWLLLWRYYGVIMAGEAVEADEAKACQNLPH